VQLQGTLKHVESTTVRLKGATQKKTKINIMLAAASLQSDEMRIVHVTILLCFIFAAI